MITYLRYGSFAASMTGNVIFAGRQLALLEGEDLKGRLKRTCSQDCLFYFGIMLAWSLGLLDLPSSLRSLGSLVYHQISRLNPRTGAVRSALLVALPRGGKLLALSSCRFSTAIDLAYNLSTTSSPRVRWWILGLVPIFGVGEAGCGQALLSSHRPSP